MSWLSGIAGKAEELLNKVDQSAAESLNTSLTSQGSRPNTPKPSITNEQVGGFSDQPTHSRSDASSSPSQNRKQPIGHGSTGQSIDSKPIPKRLSKKTLDDELFEFLNSDGPKDVRKKLVHSRQSSTGSTKTIDSGLHFTARPQTPADNQSSKIPPASKSTSDENHSPSDRNSGSSTCPSDYEVVENPNSDMTSSMMSTQSTTEDDQNKKSQELENSLLRDEVQSLNSEMTSLLQRTRQAESDLSEVKHQNDLNLSKISNLEQTLREFRDRETDQTELLKAKDSQIAILRVRYDELQEEITAKTSRLNELEQDRERILQDHSDSSGLHSQALDSLKQKLVENEELLKKEREQFHKSEQDYSTRQFKLEAEQQSLSENIVQLQRKLTDERNRSESTSQQLKNSRVNLEAAKQELKDYKEKATRILQTKDKLISSLREGAGSSDAASSDLSAGIAAEAEQEKNMLRQELEQSNSTIESLRMELQDLEVQMQTDHDESRETIENLEDRIRKEEMRANDLEQELRAKTDELNYTQEQIVSQKTSLQQQIYERDQEIEKLRNQVMSKKLSGSNENELETRLRSLTENLIQKQTLVESLSTERNSLKFQLERSESMCKDIQKSAQATTSSTTVYVGDEDGVRQRGHLPGFMKESPNDPEFTKRVKQAANTIDKFSIRLGVFLRRYPIARVFVIVYMLLLHLWTMIVLLTYQPEMHGADDTHLPIPIHDAVDVPK